MCDNKSILVQNVDELLKKHESNLRLNQSFKFMKKSFMNYIENLSKEFGSMSINNNVQGNERDKMNSIVENLISSLHEGSVITCADANTIPFLLLVDKNDANGNPVYDLGTLDSDMKNLDKGNVSYLYPNKLSFQSECVSDVTEPETLFYFINSITLLFNPDKSSLQLRMGFCDYKLPSKDYLYPLNIERSSCFFKTYTIIPASADSVWTDESDINDHIHNAVMNNNDLTYMLGELDNIIFKTKNTDQLIKTKLALLRVFIKTNV